MNKFGSMVMILLLMISSHTFSQEEEGEDSIRLHLTIREMFTDKKMIMLYNRELRKLRKVYPMALKAKALLTQYQADLEAIEKKKDQKKYSKKAHEDLKDQFTYSIKNLYSNEGELLMQLIHRETNMTVKEIIDTYRGGFQASVYSGMGSIFDQNLNAKYDPKGVNKMTEIVLQDILSGQVEFNPEMDPLTKEEFKKSQLEYRERKKNVRKSERQRNREKRIRERQEDKKKRENKKQSN